MNLGEKIDSLVQQRDTIRDMQQKVDALRAAYDGDVEDIMVDLQEAGLDKATGELGTISLKETVVAHVQDWDKVYNYILRQKHFQLMQRRIADGAFRELLEIRKGKNIPGIQPFHKKGINLRKLG